MEEQNNEVIEVEAQEKEKQPVREPFKAIEKNRQEFDAVYKKQRKINTAIVAVAGVVCMAVFLGLSKWFWIAVIVVAAVLVVLYIYSSRMKKDMDIKIKTYISDYYTLSNDYVFDNPLIKDLQYNIEEKLADNEFPNAGFIAGISSVGSRNMVRGIMCDRPFKAADCVAKVRGTKKEEVCFLGKFFMIDLKESYEHKTVIYIKSHDENGAGPNDLEGLEEVKDLRLSDRVCVWSNDPQVKTLFTKKFIDALSMFDPNNHLVDVAISVIQDKIYVALSYENELMVLPLLEPYQEAPTKQYAEDVQKLVNLIDVLSL